MAQVAKPTAWLGLKDQWLPVVQRADNGTPTFNLPDNRIMVVANKFAGVRNETIVGRGGVTALMWGQGTSESSAGWIHASILYNTGKQPSWGIDESDGGMTFITKSDMEFTASTVPLSVIEADEWLEGGFACLLPSGKPRWYYEKRKQMHEAAGKVYRSLGSYGNFNIFNVERWEFLTGGGHVTPTDGFFKAKLASKAAARSSCAHYYLYGDGIIGVNIKNYQDRPDVAVQYYQRKYAIEVHSKAVDKVGGIGGGFIMYLDWGKFESLGGNTISGNLANFRRHMDNPPGTLTVIDKHPQIDDDLQVANIFILGFCMTDGYFMFDEPDLFGTDPNNIYTFNTSFVPDTPGGPVPQGSGTTTGAYPNEPYHWPNNAFEASWYYYNCRRTEGVSWKYGKYTVVKDNPANNIVVDVQPDGTDILYHAAANDGPYTDTGRRGRADFMYRVKGNSLDMFVFDPSRGKDTRETLLLQPVAGFSMQVVVRGAMVHVYNETI